MVFSICNCKFMVLGFHHYARSLIKKLALLLVGAASLPNLFDAIKLQYQLVLEFFHLEDAGMILVRGVKDKGDIKGNEALREAYKLGLSIE